MSDTDLELLALYTRQHAEDAFTEIVRRHLDLVHSAALRQVRSPQLAQEVTQSTFITLARHAHRLAPDTILIAWLYQVTRREAIDVVRREARRQLRERIASEMNAMNGTAADWTHIEPLLDEAMHALDETDRAAVLLRYFENKSLREVGTTLGTSENAAQKRLSRAVERLREFFAKRGVSIAESGLVVVISANGVQAAPLGLFATISTAAALVGATVATTTATATKAIVMTTLQRTLITVTLAAAASTGIYEVRQASTLRNRVEILQQQQNEQNKQLTSERDDATRKLAALRDDNERLNRNTAELLKLRGEARHFRETEQKMAQLKKTVQSANEPMVESVGQANVNQEQAELFMRVFKVDTETLVQNMTRSSAAKEGESNQEMLSRYIKENGVELEPPARFILDERTGNLIVRATLANLDTIESLMHKLESNQ